MSSADCAILTYHSLDDSASVISTAPRLFALHMKMLAETGTRVAPLGEVTSVPGAVALTFDDGFRNFLEHALPVLEKYNFPATVFVVSGHCGGRNDWPSQPAGVPLLPLMTWNELRALARSRITLGAHTATHPKLTVLSEERILEEVRNCRAAIQDKTGQSAENLAYPYGAVNAVVRRIVGPHFRLACGTALRYLSHGDDVLNLPRVDAYYLQNPAVFRYLMHPAGRCYVAGRRFLRTVRECLSR